MNEFLNNSAVCLNESCSWILKQYCKLPDLCPGRNKNVSGQSGCTGTSIDKDDQKCQKR